MPPRYALRPVVKNDCITGANWSVRSRRLGQSLFIAESVRGGKPGQRIGSGPICLPKAGDSARKEVQPLSASPRVLIVDESNETRQVLREVLQSRGMQILEAERADEGLALARDEHPDLIVLDLEIQHGTAQQVSASFAETSHDQHTPLILLGSARVRRTAPAGGEFVQKPYHYAPLIRRIEQLLADAA